MAVASGCGEQEVGVASGSGWNICVWLLGVVERRYIDFFILLILTPLVSVLYAAASLLFVHFIKCFLFFNIFNESAHSVYSTHTPCNTFIILLSKFLL